MTTSTSNSAALGHRGGPLTIGVIGPHDLVQQVMRLGREAASPVTSRIQGVAYRSEREAAGKVTRMGGGVDVYLFASPVPFAYARQAGELNRPATCIPLGGASLLDALARAAVRGRLGTGRLSIDVVPHAEIKEVYAGVGLSLDGMRLHQTLADADTLTDFHLGLQRRGVTSAALTCVHAVANRLEAAGAPALHIRPTASAIRAALQAAEALGRQHRLEAAQLAVVIIEVPGLRDPATRRGPRYWREELRQGVQRLLVQEAHRMNAAAWPIDDHTFLVAATRGSIAAATDGFRVRPFVDCVRDELDTEIRVGIGMGHTTHAAESHARAALTATQGIAVDGEGHVIAPADLLAPVELAPSEDPQSSRKKAIKILARLAEKLAERGSPAVVDSVRAAGLLGVHERTARRHLKTLVDEGLAWPLPSNQTQQPGRPRALLHLNTDLLTTRGGEPAHA